MNRHANILVYIVDDDKLYSEALRQSIEVNCKELEPHVELFIVGETLLMSIDKKPDLVILDYSLNSKFPDAINGLEVLMRIKEVSPNTKVLMLSVKDDPAVAMKAVEAGAYDYVIKDKKAMEKINELVKKTHEDRRSFFERIASFFNKSTRKTLAVLETR